MLSLKLQGAMPACLLLLLPALHGQTPDIQRSVTALANPRAPVVDPVTLPTNPAARRKLEAARDYIQSRDWAEAVRLIQALLDAREDSFLRAPVTRADGKGAGGWLSTRRAAERLLDEMPAAGLAYYRLAYDAPAEKLLKEAVRQRAPDLMAQVVRRYRYTAAGADALNLLGTYHLDRGRGDLAAHCYQRLLEQATLNRLPPVTLLKAALAFRGSGDRVRLAQVRAALLAQVESGKAQLGGQPLTADLVGTAIERWQGLPLQGDDWPLYRGNPQRMALSQAVPPLLEPHWRIATTEGTVARSWLALAMRQPADEGPSLPASVPIAAGSRLIFRSHAGVQALDARTGQRMWKTALPRSLETLLADPGSKVQLERWFHMYQGSGSQLEQNSIQGTLSSDGQLVYAIDDLPLPPHPQHFMEMEAGRRHYFGPLRDAIYHNRLCALDAATGQVVWMAGGRGRGVPAELADAYFLGPPLPLDSGVFALVEKNQDIQLVCLSGEHGEVLWSQHLASATDKMLLSRTRRVDAVHLAYQDGLLICPTHAGVVVGVDLLSRGLAWAQTYPQHIQQQTDGDEPLMGQIDLGPPRRSWRACAPLLADGRVVLTTPDGDGIRCLRQSDGAILWQAVCGADAIYVAAVYQGKVLIIGRFGCRALSLATGQPLWELPTAVPAGQGVLAAGAGVYYLPLESGDLLAINLDYPRASTRIARRGDVRPGNLFFHEGILWSQSATELVAFGPALPRLAVLDERLRSKPDDADTLLERAQLMLERGEPAAAVADLRSALPRLAGQRADQARDRLFQALTSLLERDFAASEKYLDEYRTLALASLPAQGSAAHQRDAAREQGRRQATYLALLAQGRQRQGRLLDALSAYRQLNETQWREDVLMPGGDAAVEIRPDLWARGKFADLFHAVTGPQRQALWVQVERQLRDLAAAGDADALGRYLALFDSVPAAEAWPLSAARTVWIDGLSQSVARSRSLAALWQLSRLHPMGEHSALRAQALLGQSRLLTDVGMTSDAVECLWRLAREYPAERVHGRTPTEMLEDLATDKRLAGQRDRQQPAWVGRNYKAVVAPSSSQGPQLTCVEMRPSYMTAQELPRLWPDPDHRPPVSFQNIEFHFDPVTARLTVSNRRGAPSWSVSVPGGVGVAQEGACSYCLLGHLAVVTTDRSIAALDLINRRLLWTRDLLEGPVLPGQGIAMNMLGRIDIMSMNGRSIRRPGLVGPLGHGGIFLVTRAGLLALDPLTGQPRWLRRDVPRSLEVFGDEDHLFLVDVEINAQANGMLNATSIQAVRARDGSSVANPDAVPAFQNRKRILGRRLLVQEAGPQGAVVLRLYDVLTGKDDWKRAFPVNSVVLDSIDRELLAVAQPDGLVALVDLKAGDGRPGRLPRQLLVDGKALEGVQGGTLLADDKQLYLAFSKPANGVPPIIDGPFPLFQGALNGVPVGGKLFAFDRATGAWRWSLSLPSQAILVTRFEELPLIQCAAFCQRQIDPSQPPAQVFAVQSIDKLTGKTVILREYSDLSMPFDSLSVDPQTGVIELIGRQLKVRHLLEQRAANVKDRLGTAP